MNFVRYKAVHPLDCTKRSGDVSAPKRFCTVWIATKVQKTPLPLPFPMTLSKMRTDTPLCCPSITFQTCLIDSAGYHVRENEAGRGRLILREEGENNLEAEGPMYRKPHLEASASMSLARKNMRSLTKAKIATNTNRARTITETK
jgi:hypothetical protein